MHWKNWCWSWNSILWTPDAKSWLIRKDPAAGKDWGQEEKGTTEDEMVEWHHRLNGHEFEQALGVDREAWCAAVHGVTKCWTRLGWTELNLWLIRSQGCDSQTCWMNKEVGYTLCPSVSSSSSLTSSSAHIMSIITLPKPLFFCAD